MATPATPDSRPQEDPAAPRGIRAFFALSPDAEVKETLAALGRDVARKCRGRAVPPDNAHLTLAFLGDVAKGALPVLEAVGSAAPKTELHVANG